MITYRQITTADREYESEKALRDEVLRVPLGLTLSEADVRGEDGQIHLLAMDGQARVVGCVLIAPEGNGTARVRQMAVAERLRGRGIGTGLMAQAEILARALPVRKLTIHARLSARGFYERLGYRAASDTFIEMTIPHIAMEKPLAPENPHPEPGAGAGRKHPEDLRRNPE
jgi:predicted GNAT family N-acyltransferase